MKVFDPQIDPFYQFCDLEPGETIELDPKTFIDEATAQEYETRVQVAEKQILLWRRFSDFSLPLLVKNALHNVSHFDLENYLPVSLLCKRLLGSPAIIVGNGPSALECRRDYGIHYLCWHVVGKYPITQAQSVIAHADARQPLKDFAHNKKLYENSIFIATPSTSPKFLEIAQKYGQQTYIYYNQEMPIDRIVAGMYGFELIKPFQGTVVAMLMNCAILAGHKTLILYGVDLQDEKGNAIQAAELYKAVLEQYPVLYPDIEFVNASLSDLRGFTKL